MTARALQLLCLGALALACATTAERHFAAGRRAVEAGDPPAAQRELEAGRALELAKPTGWLAAIDLELGDLYATYPDLGRESEVEGLYKESLSRYEKTFDSDDTKYPAVLQKLGDYYVIEERWADAAPILERFLGAMRGKWTVDQIYQSQQASALAKAYGAVGRRADQAKLRELIDEPLARKTLAASPLPPSPAPRAVSDVPKSQLYPEPNARDREGRPIFVHFGERDMPLRVSIDEPDTPASDGSAEATRAVAVQGIREWESAAVRVLPWFRLEIVSGDPRAPVQVAWSRRTRGYTAGFGEIRLDESGSEPRTRALVTLSTQPLPVTEARQSLSQVYANAVHAFGGALGLGYCWECDSVRSMAWLERSDIKPTDVDLRTLQALTALPNGQRGEPDAAPGAGLVAELPFLNIGTDRQIFIDLAPPDVSSFVVQLDTGAQAAIITPAYARALGISNRVVREGENWRDTVTGHAVGIWMSSQGENRREAFNYALLGGEFLSQFVVEIDYRHRRVRFFDPNVAQVGGPQPRAGETVVAMSVAENRPYVQLQLGTGTALALLDTGDSGSVSISEEAAAELGIAVDPNAPRSTWQNVIATAESAEQRLPELGIAGVRVEDVEVEIALRGTGVRIERMAVGDEVLLGQGVLRRFLVRLDYPRQRLGLTRQ